MNILLNNNDFSHIKLNIFITTKNIYKNNVFVLLTNTGRVWRCSLQIFNTKISCKSLGKKKMKELKRLIREAIDESELIDRMK